MAIVGERAKETTQTQGNTNAYDLDGPVSGFQSLVVSVKSKTGAGTGPWVVRYVVTDETDWEVGIATLTEGTGGNKDTLTPTSVKDSTNGGSRVNWGAGTRNVFISAPAHAISPLTDGSGPGLLARTAEDAYAERTLQAGARGVVGWASGADGSANPTLDDTNAADKRGETFTGAVSMDSTLAVTGALSANGGLTENALTVLAKQSTRVGKTANQSVATGVASPGTALTFDTEDFDEGGWHDNATNNTRITPDRAGVYIVSAVVAFESNATGTRTVRVRKNNTSDEGATTQNAVNGQSTNMSIFTLANLNGSTDYLELYVQQTSGGPLDVLTGTEFVVVGPL